MNRNVLLLNSSEEIIKVINWKKAIKLLVSGKAKKPYNYSKSYSIRTVRGEYKIPAAIVLVKYVYMPYSEDSISPSRQNVFKRDDNTCQYCRYRSKNPKKLTIDHVHPRSRGGGTQWTNLVTACPKCNVKKGNRLLKECQMSLINKPKKPRRLALQMIGLDTQGKKLWERWIQL
jgi:5-methylcytosine-specific restriction endonuclease McrA